MGGDGGVIASNRRYMRGAGTADHTADAKRSSTSLSDEVAVDRERCRQIMTTCALTGSSLEFKPSSPVGEGEGVTEEGVIVACPHGRLYGKEAAVEALLRRKQKGLEGGGGDDAADWSQVRGLKDLHSARFKVVAAKKTKEQNQQQQYVPVCPITGVEINGAVGAFLIVPPKKKKNKKSSNDTATEQQQQQQPNVLSERAIKEMGLDSLQVEYGPFDEKDMIRLAPPVVGGVFDKIKKDWEIRMTEEKMTKKTSKKGDKKRKKEGDAKIISTVNHHGTDNSHHGSKKSRTSSRVGGGGVAQAARNNVASAVASNSVLSSLFTSTKSNVSEKEKKDNLFAR